MTDFGPAAAKPLHLSPAMRGRPTPAFWQSEIHPHFPCSSRDDFHHAQQFWSVVMAEREEIIESTTGGLLYRCDQWGSS
jgi:hypothetical protein